MFSSVAGISEKRKSISSEKLRQMLFWYSALVFFVFFVVLTLSIMVPLYDRLKASENSRVYHDVQFRAMAVNEWLQRSFDVAYQITSRSRMWQELEKYNLRQTSLANLRTFTEPKLADAMRISKEIRGITRLDRNGRPVAAKGENIVYSDLTMNYTKALDISISSPVMRKGHEVVVVSAPIRNRSNQYLGADLVMFDMSNLKEIISSPKEERLQKRIVLGILSEDEILPLCCRNGEFLHREEDELVNRFLKKAFEGRSGLDVTNRDHVSAYHSLKAANWGIVAIQDKDRLYGPLNMKLMLISMTAVLIYMVCLLGLWFLLQPLAHRLLIHTDDLKKKIREKTDHLEIEIAERRRAEASLTLSVRELETTHREKEQLIRELKEALENVKVLSGLVPICAECKKIRDDKGYWNSLESYIQKHSAASFSHGLCPECADRLYKDETWYVRLKNKKKLNQKTGEDQ